MQSRIMLKVFCLFTIAVCFVEPKGNRITSCTLESSPRSIVGYLIVECNETQSQTLTSSTLNCGRDDFYEGLLFALVMPMSFRNCEMSKLPINVFENNPSLNMLNISNIGLEMLEKSNFVGARNLQKLFARHNKLKDLPANVFAETHLDYLNLADNQFTSVAAIGLAGASNLKTLVLSTNNVTHLTAKSFENLTSLENLNLSFNNLGHLDTNLFDRLPNLMALAVTHANISNLEFMTFAKLTKLSALDLSGNPLKAIDFGDHLPVFHSLMLFNINSSQIHELNGFSIQLFPRLEHLDVTNNDFNCSHLKQFLGTFNVQQTRLSVSPNPNLIRDGNYRGIGCHPVKHQEVNSTEVINASGLSGAASAEHIHSIQQVHDKLSVVHALMTFMIIAFIITVVGLVIYINRLALIARIQGGRIRPRLFQSSENF